MTFDPRLTPARPDLAARHLEGQVEAERFVDATVCEVFDPRAPVRRAPVPDAPLETETLKGERVSVYETTDEGWCWGQLASDGYVGWIPANALTTAISEPTMKVRALEHARVPRAEYQDAADRGFATRRAASPSSASRSRSR